ncbi:MAG: hypothetical protein IT556_13540 [Acetobacteraceae bacterium]|nr:hypothetical protein [Acetobacteraceae bacterium]
MNTRLVGSCIAVIAIASTSLPVHAAAIAHVEQYFTLTPNLWGQCPTTCASPDQVTFSFESLTITEIKRQSGTGVVTNNPLSYYSGTGGAGLSWRSTVESGSKGMASEWKRVDFVIKVIDPSDTLSSYFYLYHRFSANSMQQSYASADHKPFEYASFFSSVPFYPDFSSNVNPPSSIINPTATSCDTNGNSIDPYNFYFHTVGQSVTCRWGNPWSDEEGPLWGTFGPNGIGYVAGSMFISAIAVNIPEPASIGAFSVALASLAMAGGRRRASRRMATGRLEKPLVLGLMG